MKASEERAQLRTTLEQGYKAMQLSPAKSSPAMLAELNPTELMVSLLAAGRYFTSEGALTPDGIQFVNRVVRKARRERKEAKQRGKK